MTCDGVDGRHEVLERAVAARLCLCCLPEVVDALDEAVSDAAVEPGKDTIAMAHQLCGDLLDRFEARKSGPRQNDLAHAAFEVCYTRCRRVQERLMLEGIEVPAAFIGDACGPHGRPTGVRT